MSAFAFDPVYKTLTFLNSQPSGGETPVYVNVYPSTKWLINDNYTQGSVSVYPLQEDGGIDSVIQHLSYTEGSINPERQDRSHVHSAVFSPDIHVSPDGRFLYAANRGKENNIAIFSIANDGRLHFIAYQRTFGKHPRNFA